MSIIRINGISKTYGRHPVLRDVWLKIDRGERIGLIGENGSGKTTLFRLLLDREEPDSGTIEIDDGLTIGYFSQFSELEEDRTIEAILDDEFHDVHELERALSEIETEIEQAAASGGDFDKLIRRQTALFEKMDRIDSWNYRYKIDTVLTKLHFSDVHRRCTVSELSGGWKNRCSLAQLLIRNPDIILLDEPTNYLDTDGIEWLAGWLTSSGRTVITVSHDRAFLEEVSTKICDIENCKIYEYSGSYADYIRQKQSRLREIENDGRNLGELLVMEENAIRDRVELNKRIRAGKSEDSGLGRQLANAAKRSSQTASEKTVASLYWDLYVPEKTVDVWHLDAGHDSKTVVHDVNFFLCGGERLGIVGPNGCGKSTLIDTLLERIPRINGKVTWGGGSRVFWNELLDEMNPNESVIQTISGGMTIDASRKKIRKFIQMLGLSDDMLNVRVGNLSGGQKSRVALTKALISGATTIILDEPTNHLDIATAQVLELALMNFPGSVIFTSHDRFFIDKVATRLLVYEEGTKTFMNWNGTLETWNAARQEIK